MKRSSTLFLKIVIVCIAITVIAGMIVFPQTEGRAANLDLVHIYLDPFIIYIYVASISFFVGLYQAFKLLHLIDGNKAFSKDAINALKVMKIASISLIVFIILALCYIRFFVQGEDSTGPTMLGIMMIIGFGVIATAAGIFQKLFQHAIDIKSEHDLTV
jgi:hypothetical protein